MIATNRKNVWVVRPLLWVLSLLIAATPLALAASIPNERVRTPAIENTPCLWAKAELTPQRHWVNHDAKLAIAQESRLATKGGARLKNTSSFGPRSLGAAEFKPYTLPENARRTTNPNEIFSRLEKFNGIDPKLASKRLHEIKAATGRGGADNVLFDLSGGVYDPKTLNWLGSLTEGGAKRLPLR